MAKVDKLRYSERALVHKSAVARRLFAVMEAKKSNLCVSLDVQTTAELLDLVDKLGPYVCMFKTHVDVVTDYSYAATVEPLVALAKKHNFLIFEDRKFADIGSTVKAQYTAGVYKIAQWSDLTNAHSVPGPGVIDGLRAGAATVDADRGLLLLAEMSSKGSLATGEYTAATLAMAQANADFVFGFISQSRLGTDDDDFLVLTPGVGLDDKGDGLGQQYRTVDDAVATGSDVLIVGRGILGKGRDPVAESVRYQTAGWKAYEARVAA
ncbi:Orotidine 5'-phosphate decarboxylase domain-containing protein [Dipodascopsis tothii]|uniref:Orotidine 5'-phosphate decarboxylase domain-containing protein n=1 Tax=Dipodascopsis tothii TaxID=44089 RepID=UPI0034CE49DB